MTAQIPLAHRSGVTGDLPLYQQSVQMMTLRFGAADILLIWRAAQRMLIDSRSATDIVSIVDTF